MERWLGLPPSVYVICKGALGVKVIGQRLGFGKGMQDGIFPRSFPSVNLVGTPAFGKSNSRY